MVTVHICFLVLVFDHEGTKSATNWIGCFDEECSIASVVHGMVEYSSN